MFRLSGFLRELNAPTPVKPRANPPGPVVVWNLVRRCNLACRHCYSASSDKDFAGELTTAQAREVLFDLKRARVPALILSGGEPLLRPDLFTLTQSAKELGFHLSLSSNGTLIDAKVADRIAQAGFDYVGVSLDGTRAEHDRFRGRDGAYVRSVSALRLLRDRGVKVGMRFTMTGDNARCLPSLLKFRATEKIPRFYLSHLNYAGRGNRNRAEDADARTARAALDQLFEAARVAGDACEFVTGNSDADGPLFLLWVRRHFPDQAGHIEAKLRQWGGNASGVNVANIDTLGWVHPDTMWGHVRLGNVLERPFSEIWRDRSDPLRTGLAAHPRAVTGRCGRCRWLTICNGGSRVRAERVFADVWAEDPACPLTDEEIA